MQGAAEFGYSVNGSFAEYALAAGRFPGQNSRPAFVCRCGTHSVRCLTTYKGLKETDARPGEWVVISGVGGLGHVAIHVVPQPWDFM